MKIAILLSSVALALAIAALLYIVAFSSTPGPTVKDTSPPLVIGWDTGAVRPDSAVEVSITVEDNQSGKVSGLDPDKCRIQWGISSSDFAVVPDKLNWSQLQFQVAPGTGTTILSASVPARDWTQYNGTYLLVDVLLYDRAGNSAWDQRSLPIRTANLPELRFVPGSLSVTVSGTGTYRTVIITAAMENVGAANSSPVLVGLYQSDPDPNHHGSTTLSPLAQTVVAAVPSGGSVPVQLQLSSKSIRVRLVYLMLDTNGSLPEMDKSDNVISVALPPNAVPPASGARGFTPGFEFLATAAAAALAIILVRRMRNLRG